MQSPADLNSRFSIPGHLSFDAGPGSLTRGNITHPDFTGTIFLHGAHITHWQPRGQAPVLFMSAHSLFDPKKAIRGGVPVIFPWFGAKAGNAAAPQHGFARTAPWMLHSTTMEEDGAVVLRLTLGADENTQRHFPHPFQATFSATFGRELRMSLEIRNTGNAPFSCEEALHTYFSIGNIADISIIGLERATYIDKVDQFTRKLQEDAPIRITGETDRVYLNTPALCILDDPTLNRRIHVEKRGSDSTIVWNPWIAKSKAMADFGDDEWRNTVCIESANVADNAITLKPDQRHVLHVTIRCQSTR